MTHKRFACLWCWAEFDTANARREHSRSCEARAQVLRQVLTGKTDYRCPQCGRFVEYDQAEGDAWCADCGREALKDEAPGVGPGAPGVDATGCCPPTPSSTGCNSTPSDVARTPASSAQPLDGYNDAECC